MSSWVTTGDAPPRLSWTCGPVGTRGSAGAGAATSTATASGSAHDGVDAHAFDSARLAGGVAEPEFDAALGGVGEREVGGVGTPASEGQLGVGGKIDLDLGAFGNLAETQGAVKGGVVQSVGLGVDAHTGDAQHGLGEFGDGGVADGLALHGEMPRRADSQGRREG